jgi:hypothetical protein
MIEYGDEKYDPGHACKTQLEFQDVLLLISMLNTYIMYMTELYAFQNLP